ncbi:MAG: pentapeptide repeat-containing protein [Roseiarcus sp.]
MLTSLLGLTVAMIATILATSDTAIFYDSISPFPLFETKIRLTLAYTLTPPIFVFLHANALLHLRLLRVRLRGFETRMDQLQLSEIQRVLWRRLIRGMPFAQLNVGADALLSDGMTTFIYRSLLTAVSTITIFILPVLLLIAFQVSFVRYQSYYITYLHMITLTLDILILYWFGLSAPGYSATHWKLALKWTSAITVTIPVIWLSYFIAVPPSELRDTNEVWGLARPCCSGFQPPEWQPSGATIVREPMNEPYASGLDLVCRLTNIRQLCRYLDLRGLVLSNEYAQKRPSISDDSSTNLKRIVSQLLSISEPFRNFRFARFDGAILLGADLRGIDGRKASFVKAKLWNANFERSDLRWADFSGSMLNGAKFVDASVSDGDFDSASMIATDFRGATLFGTNFDNTNLVASSFVQSTIFLSSFRKADLTGVNFENAELIASILDQPSLTLAVPPIVCDATQVSKRIEDTSLAVSQEQLRAILVAAGIFQEDIEEIESRLGRGGAFKCDPKPFEQPNATEVDSLRAAVGLVLCETHPEQVDHEVERFVRNLTSSILWQVKYKKESWTSTSSSDDFGDGGFPVRPPFQDHEIFVLEEMTHEDICAESEIANEVLEANDDNCDNSVDRVDRYHKLRNLLANASESARAFAKCSTSR